MPKAVTGLEGTLSTICSSGAHTPLPAGQTGSAPSTCRPDPMGGPEGMAWPGSRCRGERGLAGVWQFGRVDGGRINYYYYSPAKFPAPWGAPQAGCDVSTGYIWPPGWSLSNLVSSNSFHRCRMHSLLLTNPRQIPIQPLLGNFH